MRKTKLKELMLRVAQTQSSLLINNSDYVRKHKKRLEDLVFEYWVNECPTFFPKKSKRKFIVIESVFMIVSFVLARFYTELPTWDIILYVVLASYNLDLILTGDFLDILKSLVVLWNVKITNKVGLKLFFGYHAIELCYDREDVDTRRVIIRTLEQSVESEDEEVFQRRAYLMHGSRLHSVIFDYVAHRKGKGLAEFAVEGEELVVSDFTKWSYIAGVFKDA